MSKKKKKVLFVGAFNPNIGAIGGQLFACMSLINSDLKNLYDWILIDTTLEVPAPPIYTRIWRAILRIFRFLYSVIFNSPDTILIFTADGLSFIEKGTMTIIAKWLGKKTILAPRSGMLYDNLNEPLFKKFIVFVIKHTDIVICQGESWKKTFAELVPNPNKYQVIYNWIDVDTYAIAKKEIDEAGKPIEILFLGWLEGFKGVFELIEAITQLKSKNYHFHLTMGGDGTQMQLLKAKVIENGLQDVVTLAGWLKGAQKIEALKKADIFVLPSYAEGFPNALLEAMCAGKACVATDVGAVADILNDDTGFIIPPKNSTILEEKLALLIENEELRAKFSTNAYKKAQSQHSIEYAISTFKTIL